VAAKPTTAAKAVRKTAPKKTTKRSSRKK